jgi:hypothetical protein
MGIFLKHSLRQLSKVPQVASGTYLNLHMNAHPDRNSILPTVHVLISSFVETMDARSTTKGTPY